MPDNNTSIGDGNKLIRKFMQPDCYEMPKAKSYNKSWDLLIPVVQKIESIGITVIISYNSCVAHLNTGRPADINDRIARFTTKEQKLQGVWEVCIEVIKWYNQQPSNTLTNG